MDTDVNAPRYGIGGQSTAGAQWEKSYQEKSHGEETQTSEYNDRRPCGRIF